MKAIVEKGVFITYSTPLFAYLLLWLRYVRYVDQKPSGTEKLRQVQEHSKGQSTMSDRRRVNGPAGTTQPPSYDENVYFSSRNRDQGTARPVCEEIQFHCFCICRSSYEWTNHVFLDLKTGVTPSASGSAYLEIAECRQSGGFGMKLTCTVHGPRSLPRSAPFSPHMVLSTHVKYAPFATQKRKGYLRDAGERDLSVHLDTALRGAIIADRWPKSGVDVVVTVIEGDVDHQTTANDGLEEWHTMSVLGGCITVASAAIADAGIDCVDTVTGGVAALVMDKGSKAEPSVVIDPALSEHESVVAACCVAYSARRDEITNLWYRGCLKPIDLTTRRALIARAIMASKGTDKVVSSSLVESLTST